MIQLRHNQIKPVELAIEFLKDTKKSSRKPVIVAPTGMGKVKPLLITHRYW